MLVYAAQACWTRSADTQRAFVSCSNTCLWDVLGSITATFTITADGAFLPDSMRLGVAKSSRGMNVAQLLARCPQEPAPAQQQQLRGAAGAWGATAAQEPKQQLLNILTLLAGQAARRCVRGAGRAFACACAAVQGRHALMRAWHYNGCNGHAWMMCGLRCRPANASYEEAVVATATTSTQLGGSASPPVKTQQETVVYAMHAQSTEEPSESAAGPGAGGSAAGELAEQAFLAPTDQAYDALDGNAYDVAAGGRAHHGACTPHGVQHWGAGWLARRWPLRCVLLPAAGAMPCAHTWAAGWGCG